MKIVCDSCGTKYSIADDKVRGKVFKIRCKKCSHIIVVRGTNEAAAAAAPAAAAPADGGGWHLVVDGDQVGPVSESDIRGRVERGEINADTYVWKEGFADWLKLSAIPEFASLVTPAEGGVFADGTGSGAVNGDSGAHHQSGPASAGLFGGGAAAGDEADVFGGIASPAAAKRGDGGDLFASPAVVSKPAPEESRWPAASAAPAGHDGGRVENLTGQRHENSVLFSLSNLQSLAMPAPAAAKSVTTTAPTSEGSGLIDIRAMAATTLGSSSSGGSSFGGGGPVDDLPAFGAFSPAAPVLLALPTQSGPSKMVYVGFAAIGVLFIGVVIMGIVVLGGSKPAPAPAPAAVAAAPGAPAAPAGASAPVAANTPPPPANPTQLPPSELPPREQPPAPAAAAAPSPGKSEHEHHHGKDHGKDSGGSSKKGADDGKKAAPAAAAPAAAAPPPEKKPAKGSLDDLLEGALNHKPAAPAPRPRADDSGGSASAGGGGPLSKGAVVAGMNSVKGKVSDCYQEFKVPGMAMVNVVIGKSGKVSSATVTGKFAGTPTGSCVEKAVKSASFPPSDGLTTPYPFQLK
jgi:predicted Zn finger-like uncharacterized protein